MDLKDYIDHLRIAVAVAVIKSKPTHMPLRTYLQLLKKSWVNPDDIKQRKKKELEFQILYMNEIQCLNKCIQDSQLSGLQTPIGSNIIDARFVKDDELSSLRLDEIEITNHLKFIKNVYFLKLIAEKHKYIKQNSIILCLEKLGISSTADEDMAVENDISSDSSKETPPSPSLLTGLPENDKTTENATDSQAICGGDSLNAKLLAPETLSILSDAINSVFEKINSQVEEIKDDGSIQSSLSELIEAVSLLSKKDFGHVTLSIMKNCYMIIEKLVNRIISCEGTSKLQLQSNLTKLISPLSESFLLCLCVGQVVTSKIVSAVRNIKMKHCAVDALDISENIAFLFCILEDTLNNMGGFVRSLFEEFEESKSRKENLKNVMEIWKNWSSERVYAETNNTFSWVPSRGVDGIWEEITLKTHLLSITNQWLSDLRKISSEKQNIIISVCFCSFKAVQMIELLQKIIHIDQSENSNVHAYRK